MIPSLADCLPVCLLSGCPVGWRTGWLPARLVVKLSQSMLGSVAFRPQAGFTFPSTANLRAKILDFRGFDSSGILIFRGGILISAGTFPEMLSQQIVVGIILVGRLGAHLLMASVQGGPGSDSKSVKDRFAVDVGALVCSM